MPRSAHLLVLVCHFMSSSPSWCWTLARGWARKQRQPFLHAQLSSSSSSSSVYHSRRTTLMGRSISSSSNTRLRRTPTALLSRAYSAAEGDPVATENQTNPVVSPQLNDQGNTNITTTNFDNENSDTAATTTATGPKAPNPPSPDFDSSSILAIDPNDIEVVRITDPLPDQGGEPDSLQNNSSSADLIRRLPFVTMFRGSANYIANHRGTTAVYHLPGGLLATNKSSSSTITTAVADGHVLRDLMNDIALTWLLGMNIVLVAGCRHQVAQRLGDEGMHTHQGLRVTDATTLRIVKEEAGYVRFEVERQLARALRQQGAGGAAGLGHYDGNVVSGNFYSAQPFGILDGTDYAYTGFVRRVEVDKIRKLHANRDICLLTTLGVSPSGEVFNCNSESLAATVAGSLGASKVVFFTEKDLELRHRVYDRKIQSLRLSDARQMLTHASMRCNKRGFVMMDEEKEKTLSEDEQEMLLKIGWSIQALEQGVKRAHIISPKFGSVLQELYTRDGSGTLVSGDLYEGIRRASVLDVSGIYDLILPLVQAGTLIERPKAALEKDIDMYYVYTRDNNIVACGQLKLFEEGFSEIGCLVVNKEFRARGRGDAMLGYLERLSVMNGCTSIFVLSTQTMEWFVERGFEEVSVDKLPPSRRAVYNYKRASKIYMKKIESSRDLDASELWWNR